MPTSKCQLCPGLKSVTCMLMSLLQIDALKVQHNKAEAEVESRRQLLRSCDDQLQQLEEELGEIAERKTNATVELKKLEHQVSGLTCRFWVTGLGFRAIQGEFCALNALPERGTCMSLRPHLCLSRPFFRLLMPLLG